MDENVRNEIINDVDNHRNMEGNIPASSFDMACPGAQGIDINDDGKADSCVQASAEIEIYSQDRLKRLNKGQLIDLLMETQAKYLELFKAYTHQAEIVFRDRSVRFGSGADSSYTAPAPEKKDESSDKEEGNHSEPKEKRPGRTSHPVRTPGFSEHRFDDIAVLEKDQKPAEKELAEYFGSHEYVFISKKEIEDYGVLPARIYLRRRLVYTYKDLQTGELHTFGSAQELKFMSGSLITPELIAYVAWEYYFNCIPVNRQVKAFGTEGVNLTKQNLYECMRKCGNAAISPIAARMRKLGLQSMKNQMDESYVVDREERENTGRRNCYMWQMRTSEMLKDGPQIISYSFVNSRSAEELNKILDGYQGKVECDGYSAYPAVMKINGGIEIACCFWHVEHYFTDVIRGIPKWNEMSEDERMRIPAYGIIKDMTEVFNEEKKLRDLSADERRDGRMNIILPKVEKIYETIEKHAADPMLDNNSLFGKAVTYAINRKPYVMVAVKDPELPIHNLGCERGFVRFAVLRNNIRAFSTNKGARSAADYMTVGDTCQANGGKVQTYYRYLIETIPGVMEKHRDQGQLNDLSFLDAYMPWSAGYREYEQNLREKGRNLFRELIDHKG